MAASDNDLFEPPAMWRTHAALAIARTRPDRQAIASPGPAFPHALKLVERMIDRSPAGAVVDVGAGLAGISDWLGEHTSRFVVPTDASHASCAGAHTLFPSLTPVRADASNLPFRSGSAGVMLLAGLVSMLNDDEFEACVVEVRRCLRTGGRLAIVDLVASGRTDVTRSPNIFRSIEHLQATFVRLGFSVIDQAIADTAAGSWERLNPAVDVYVDTHQDDDCAYRAWQHDQRHLRSVMDSGLVMVAALGLILDVANP